MERITQEAWYRPRMMKYRQTHTRTETAMRYKMSEKTVTKWQKRWDGTAERLEDQSRRPRRIALAHSEEGLRKIRRVLKKHR